LDVIQSYNSLIRLIEHTRENFDYFEIEAITKSVNKNYKINTTRKKKRTIFHDEFKSEEVDLSAREI
jgi:hypothetical protein